MYNAAVSQTLRQEECHAQEEMKRGYFDDFKDLKETQGRMFAPSEALSPASTSPQLPTIGVRLGPHQIICQLASISPLVTSAFANPPMHEDCVLYLC